MNSLSAHETKAPQSNTQPLIYAFCVLSCKANRSRTSMA